MSLLRLQPHTELQFIKGVSFPAAMKFRQLIVTGPPGSGKSAAMKTIGGWFEETSIDISREGWWRLPLLNIRPREIHFALPFKGMKEAITVFDPIWLESAPPLELEPQRILIPPPRGFILGVDWRTRYYFEFLLPPAELLYDRRHQRAESGTHIVDMDLDLQQIQLQVVIYEQVALHMARSGCLVFIRNRPAGPPLRIVPPN